jgi:hypothetical protein
MSKTRGRPQTRHSRETELALRRLLEAAGGTAPAVDLIANVKAVTGANKRQVKEAKRKIGARSVKTQYDGPWNWTFDAPPPEPQVEQINVKHEEAVTAAPEHLERLRTNYCRCGPRSVSWPVAYDMKNGRVDAVCNKCGRPKSERKR